VEALGIGQDASQLNSLTVGSGANFGPMLEFSTQRRWNWPFSQQWKHREQ
jgi:hypothetical protein